MAQTELKDRAGVVQDVERRPGFIRRQRNRFIMAGVLLMALLGSGTAANATAVSSTNPTGGLFSAAQSWMSTYGIPAIVAIVLLGSLFFLGLKWYHKGASQGSK